MPRLTRDERNQAIGMVIGGMSRALVAMRNRVHRNTISRLISRHRATDRATEHRQYPSKNSENFQLNENAVPGRIQC